MCVGGGGGGDTRARMCVRVRVCLCVCESGHPGENIPKPVTDSVAVLLLLRAERKE